MPLAGGAGRPASSGSTCRPIRPPAGDLASESTTRLSLLDGVDRLPAQMRAAVVLRYYADLPVEEVAAVLGKSPNTIKAQLQTRARSTAHPPRRTDRPQPRGGPPCMTTSSKTAFVPSFGTRATRCR